MDGVNRKKKPFSLISPVTRQFVRAAWEVHDHSLGAVLHSYVYARWPYLYIGLGKGEHPIAKRLAPLLRAWQRLFPRQEPGALPTPSPTQATGTVADCYHAKVMPLAQACQLVTINQPIELPDLEQVIPYVRARALILHNPDQIIVMECPCRTAEKDPCGPLDVCLVIGEPFVSFLLEHYPSRGRRITQAEAVSILETEDARGRVHHAFFNDPMLGRFFGICNCCACCCAAMRAHGRGTPMLAPSGFVAQIDGQACVGCDTCQGFCPFGALKQVNGASYADPETCMGCGICVSKCPQDAIILRREPSKGVPLEVRALIET
ncbi:MAG: 4Fe-4S binding protein [Anaerolineae bacterium]|jgi:Pyruvate/2-oxoacid:ferredoxin oxidoreductase delta subunit